MDEDQQKINELEDLVMGWRGRIIHAMTLLESLTDTLIAWHFCNIPVLNVDFIHAILGKENFNLRFKCSTLAFIFKNNFPNELLKYPELITDFERMIDVRNDFAHRVFYAYDDEHRPYDKDKLGLQYPTTKRNKRKNDPIPISQELVDGYMVTINKLIVAVGIFQVGRQYEEKRGEG